MHDESNTFWWRLDSKDLTVETSNPIVEQLDEINATSTVELTCAEQHVTERNNNNRPVSRPTNVEGGWLTGLVREYFRKKKLAHRLRDIYVGS